LAEITTQLAAIDAELVIIDTANSTILAADTNVVNEVGIATQGIYDHVDALLSNDCKANLITVPILTRSAAGFYTAPSTGLIDSLQTFLDARKEVTQTVSVTSGAIFLVPAVISVRVGVLRTYSEAVVETAVNTAIDGILRDRAFGEDLYESDVETAVLGVDGVVFTNVTIAGYLNGGVTDTGKLDSSGNLVVASSEVVTKGTTTITTELFTGT
jgi:tetrahydromethanopterin S-methyltransferase subunit H